MGTKALQAAADAVQVMSYLDYRDYLRDVYDRVKEASTSYSYITFAEELGLGTTNSARLVIARQRQLSDRSALTVAKALGLKHVSRRYFIALVQHVNARGAPRKERLFRKLLGIKQESVISGRDREQMQYFNEWYHPVVRELLRLENASSDPAHLASLLYPAVSAEKLRRSLSLLESIGLLTRDAKTGEVQSVKDAPIVLPSDATAGQLAIAQFHQAMIDLSKEAIAKVPETQSEFNAITVSLSQSEFEELRERVREFCAEVMGRESREQRRECVAQLNVQLFSMTKWKETKA